MTDINEEDLTTAYMLGRRDGCKDAERDQSLATAHGSELLAEMLDLANYCDERARLLDRDVHQHGYGSTDSRKRWKVEAGTLRATAGEIRQRCRPFNQNNGSMHE